MALPMMQLITNPVRAKGPMLRIEVTGVSGCCGLATRSLISISSAWAAAPGHRLSHAHGVEFYTVGRRVGLAGIAE